MKSVMNGVNREKEDSSELNYLVKLGLKRENKEREELEKKYSQRDLDKAAIKAYENGLEDAYTNVANEIFNKGWSEGYDKGFNAGYREAKAMSTMYGGEGDV